MQPRRAQRPPPPPGPRAGPAATAATMQLVGPATRRPPARPDPRWPGPRDRRLVLAPPLLLLLVLLLVGALAGALDQPAPSLARTPPMGWSAWKRFMCQTDCAREPHNCVQQSLFEEQARRLVFDGYQNAGYQYLNIDDCWMEQARDPITKRLVPDSKRFPTGPNGLAEYVHALNLKLGIYADCGLRTCAGFPGSLANHSRHELAADPSLPADYFHLDAQTFADWQLDLLKLDGCYIEPRLAERLCPAMSRALQLTERPILLTCEWPFYMMYAHAEPDFRLASAHCHTWRYYDDIQDSWSSVLNTIDYSVKHQSTIVRYHGPGHWFDPDQLVVGNFGLSASQQRAQMAVWSAWSAPLVMGNDLRAVDERARALLQHPGLLAVNQDPMGVWALKVASSHGGDVQVFVKPVLPIRRRCPSFFVLALNRATLGNRKRVSLELGPLLAGAPLHAAKRNLRQIEDPRADQLDPFACLERLRSAAGPSFRLEDLFAGDQWEAQEWPLPERLSARQRLEVEVAASSVRAMLLLELP